MVTQMIRIRGSENRTYLKLIENTFHASRPWLRNLVELFMFIGLCFPVTYSLFDLIAVSYFLTGIQLIYHINTYNIPIYIDDKKQTSATIIKYVCLIKTTLSNILKYYHFNDCIYFDFSNCSKTTPREGFIYPLGPY